MVSRRTLDLPAVRQDVSPLGRQSAGGELVHPSALCLRPVPQSVE